MISSYRKGFRLQNIVSTLDEAINNIKSNDFDLWEGYTNKYIIVESMIVGDVLSLKEEVWFGRERLEDIPFTNENGIKCVDRKAFIFDIEKPKEFKNNINFSIG